jgi:plastocyanin
MRTMLFAFAVGAMLACVLAPLAAQPGGTAVVIDNFVFGPEKLTIKAGTTVTWSNRDDIPHTVVSPGKFKSKVMDTDESYSFTFSTPGEYAYFCSLHPHMTGTIVVEAATGSATTQ